MTATMPMIISVDDHVVEPPHLWQTWLPEKHRERGPKIDILKYKNKSGYRKRIGHRQDLTRLKVTGIK